MLHLRDLHLKPTYDSPESVIRGVQNPFEDDQLGEDKIIELAYDYGLEKGNPIDTFRALGANEFKDGTKHLGLLNDLIAQYGSSFKADNLRQLKDMTRESAFLLIARNLSFTETSMLGLGDRYLDDAGTSPDFSLQDALKIAHSWDSLDQDTRILEALEMLLSRLDEGAASHINSAFARARHLNINFAQAHLDIQATLNEMPVRDAERMLGGKVIDVCQMPIEDYEWVFAKDSTRHARIQKTI